jgi:hypothetical protein
MTNLAKLALVVPFVLACNPEFDNRFSSVDAPRVLAVQSSPAQAPPGKAMSYQILVVDSQGTVADPRVDWSFCTQAKPVNELNDVATACFGTGENVLPFAMGSTASAKLPTNACRQFGPDIPMTTPGEPSARPTDADTTGGYYQPLILVVHDAGQAIPTLAETRLSCALASSTGAQDEEYQKRTKTNENPLLSAVIVASMGDVPLTDMGDAAPLTIAHGAKVTLRASWPGCPSEPTCDDGMCTSGETALDCPDDCTSPVGCNGAEQYAYLDPAQGSLVDRHESMRVSWFATAGEFDDDHTGRTEDEFAVTTSDNGWRAPANPGPVFLWLVLRDDRGGVDFRGFQVQVE